MLHISSLVIGAVLLLAVVASSPALAQVRSLQEIQMDSVDAQIESARRQPSSDFDQILKQIRSVLLTVQSKLKTDQLPPLKNVQLSLQTGVTRTAGGQITIFVITIGGATSSETTQVMKFTLIPPQPTAQELAKALAEATPNFSTEFSSAIIAAALAADTALSKQQTPPLELGNFTAGIKFTIQNTLQGGLNTLTLLPVNLQLSGRVTPTNTHEIVLTFEKAATGGAH